LPKTKTKLFAMVFMLSQAVPKKALKARKGFGEEFDNAAVEPCSVSNVD
jgi:hypothetical protein